MEKLLTPVVGPTIVLDVIPLTNYGRGLPHQFNNVHCTEACGNFHFMKTNVTIKCNSSQCLPEKIK